MAVDPEQVQEEQKSPPETLIAQVKEALEHLYDLSYLQNHPLARVQGLATEGAAEIAGQRLRRELAAAIESLSPGSAVPFRAPQARLYNLLTLHYVEGVTVQEAAHKLGVSRRQAHRDLRKGLENVAAVVWARRSARAAGTGSAARLSSVQAEMEQLEQRSRPEDVRVLLQRALDIVERMAAQRDVNIELELPQDPAVLSVDAVVAEQVLVETLSRAVGQAQPGAMRLNLCVAPEWISLGVRYLPAPEATKASAVDLVVTQLVDRLGWKLEETDRPDGYRDVTLCMAVQGPTILVIDDNEGLVNLLRRYLTDQACRVIAAGNGEEGLRLAEESLPDAIALDVMMPGMHGWEVLQRLRNQPQTAAIPVVIISVFKNPELAYSLGATHFLSKPVSRQDVLDAFRRVGAL